MNQQSPLTNPEALKILIFIFGVLFSIIGFFVSFYFRRSVKTNDKLDDTVSGLSHTVTELNTTVMLLKDRNESSVASCRDKHQGIAEQLKEIDQKIETHDRDIVKVKQVLKIT